MFMDEVKGAIGSRSQGSAVAEHVTYFGKQSKTSFILVSHVTKDGELAANSGVGHEVDTLLEFDPAFKYDEDGDLIEASENLRRLYTIDKNRNGPTPREAWFRMGERGVTEISEEKAQEKKRKKSRLVLLPSATDEPSES
jgi:DNA repair protein RadA/Sms